MKELRYTKFSSPDNSDSLKLCKLNYLLDVIIEEASGNLYYPGKTSYVVVDGKTNDDDDEIMQTE